MKKIIEISSLQFNLENTLVNGQCFNWSKLNSQKFKGIFRNYLIILERIDEKKISMISSPRMQEEFLTNVFLKEYLQIPQIDIEELYRDWCKRDPEFFLPISLSLPGVRCIRQDPWECVLSFICSSNNNIKRIAQLVNNLRINYGSQILIDKDQESLFKTEMQIAENQNIVEYQFPTLEQMENVTEKQLRDLGFGYRALYIVESVKIIKDKGGINWLNQLREQKDMQKIKENLTQLKGVGKKVAYCISLFSLDCPGIIPVDTHVFQLAQKFGFVKSSKSKANLNDNMHEEIGDRFRQTYGEYAGWAHQILFAGDLVQFKQKMNENMDTSKIKKLTKSKKKAQLEEIVSELSDCIQFDIKKKQK